MIPTAGKVYRKDGKYLRRTYSRRGPSYGWVDDLQKATVFLFAPTYFRVDDSIVDVLEGAEALAAEQRLVVVKRGGGVR